MTLAGLRKDIDAAPATSENSPLRYSMREFVIGKARSSRDSLGKLSMSALLAYDFVSNISGVIVIAVSLAWFVFCKKTGVSPLDPGQKPAFLVTYAAFSVILNAVRPARFALSMAISPYFERVRLGCAFRPVFRFIPVLIFRNSGFSAEFPDSGGTHTGIKSFQGKINLD
jgi:hypothetical protein